LSRLELAFSRWPNKAALTPIASAPAANGITAPHLTTNARRQDWAFDGGGGEMRRQRSRRARTRLPKQAPLRGLWESANGPDPLGSTRVCWEDDACDGGRLLLCGGAYGPHACSASSPMRTGTLRNRR
jgi:hypothetical protein